MSLVINLVTRNRPELCIETLKKTLPNIALPTTKLMVSIDHDDPKSIEQISLFALDHPQLVLSTRRREESYGEKYNRMLELPGSVYMGMTDYSIHSTPGFDKIILEAAKIFPDGIGVVYADYMDNGSFTKLNAVTAKLIRKMGYFYPPYFPYWFADHWLDDIARMIDRIAYVNLKIDITRRPGTQDMKDVGFWALLFNSLHLRRRKQAMDIIYSEDFLSPPWMKKLLSMNWPLIEHRSKLVNDGLIENSKAYEGTGTRGIWDEERYVRIKSQALDLMAELIPELQDEQDRIGAR